MVVELLNWIELSWVEETKRRGFKKRIQTFRQSRFVGLYPTKAWRLLLYWRRQQQSCARCNQNCCRQYRCWLACFGWQKGWLRSSGQSVNIDSRTHFPLLVQDTHTHNCCWWSRRYRRPGELEELLYYTRGSTQQQIAPHCHHQDNTTISLLIVSSQQKKKKKKKRRRIATKLPQGSVMQEREGAEDEEEEVLNITSAVCGWFCQIGGLFWAACQLTCWMCTKSASTSPSPNEEWKTWKSFAKNLA